MIGQEIEFHAPKALEEALALLARYGGEAKVLAGGMSLVPAMNLGLVEPTIVVSLNHVRGLDDVADEGDGLRIGAGLRHTRVARDSLIARYCPLLAEAAGLIGDVQVRHRGTIGGSLAHADPAGNYLPVVAALGASLVLRSARGERVVAAAGFFQDLMTTALAPDELLTAVRVPKLAPGSGTAYLQLTRVEGSYPIVNAAATLAPGGRAGRLAIGGTGPRPVVLDLAEHLADGVSEAALERIGAAAFAACEGAYGDLNGDPEYRRAMARVYARRALQAAISRQAAPGQVGADS